MLSSAALSNNFTYSNSNQDSFSGYPTSTYYYNGGQSNNTTTDLVKSSQKKQMIVVDSKDNLQDPSVRIEAIAGTNLFGFKAAPNANLHDDDAMK